MKKIILILLAAMLSLSLIACTGDKQTDTSRNEMAPADTTVHTLDEIIDPSAVWEQVCRVEDGVFIEGLNFDANGQMWFTDVAGHRIYTLVDGKVVIAYEDEKMMPNGAKFIADGTMLVIDRMQGICLFDAETSEYTVLFDSYNGTAFLGLNDVVLDGTKGAYITDAGNASTTNNISNVYYLTLGGNPTLELFESNIAFANGIAFSPDGTWVYIAEFDRNQVLCAPSRDASVRDTTRVFVRLDGGVGPDGLATDLDGNLYIAHLGLGEIVAVASDGLQYGAIRLPESAGRLSCNMAFHDGYLYVAEAQQSIVWRIPVKVST